MQTHEVVVDDGLALAAREEGLVVHDALKVFRVLDAELLQFASALRYQALAKTHLLGSLQQATHEKERSKSN